MNANGIETTVDIAASPQRVWRELTTFTKYPEWSRFIVAIEGQPQPGARLRVRLDDGGAALTIRPELLVARENEELCWRGTLGARVVFSGQHYFRLSPLPDGYTRFTHGEHFGGLLLPFFWKTLDTRTRKSFVRFNEALRARAEGTARLAK